MYRSSSASASSSSACASSRSNIRVAAVAAAATAAAAAAPSKVASAARAKQRQLKRRQHRQWYRQQQQWQQHGQHGCNKLSSLCSFFPCLSGSKRRHHQTMAATCPRLTVIYGSETGNAADVAERIGREATWRGYEVSVIPADYYASPLECLPLESAVIFVVATTGQGEMPANIRAMWKCLLRRSLPQSWLQRVAYAVFGLGDSSYQQYNVAAKKLDRRLMDLGASPLLPRGLGDDQHPSGYEAALDPWLLSLWAALRAHFPSPQTSSDPANAAAAAAAAATSQATDAVTLPPLGEPRIEVQVLPHDVALLSTELDPKAAACLSSELPSACAVAGADAAAAAAGAAATRPWWTPAMSAAVLMMDRALLPHSVAPVSSTAAAAVSGMTPSVCSPDGVPQSSDPSTGLRNGSGGEEEMLPNTAWSRIRPFLARVQNNRRLTADGYEREVHHVELAIPPSSGVTYSPGDVVHMWPRQDPAAVLRLLARCGLHPHARVHVYPKGAHTHRQATHLDKSSSGSSGIAAAAGVPVFDLVAATIDVSSASPRRYFFEVLSHFATDERERERLQYFSSAEGREELYEYNQRERRTVLEVLEEFPSASLPLPWLLQVCPRLQPRAFSISSSPTRHAGQLHVTVAVARWRTPFKRQRTGLCSSWLAQLWLPTQSTGPEGDSFVPVWVSRGTLTLPPPTVPLILVGPGTGCAPFRSFIHERDAVLTAATDCTGAAQAGASTGTAEYRPPGKAAGLDGLAMAETGARAAPQATENAGAATTAAAASARVEAAFGAAGEVARPASSAGEAAAPHTSPAAPAVAPVLFFFGCRGQEKDFLYAGEWEELGAAGRVLSGARGGGFAVAFSRDQPQKVYVQHKIKERAEQVWRLLREGAAVFVAGSANKMPADVVAALAAVVAEEGLMSKDAASAWVKALQRVGRLYMECWS